LILGLPGLTTLALVAGVMFSLAHSPSEDNSHALQFRLIVAAISSILACTFVIAIVSPPNNWDSMIYHMSRVMHWLQQEGVDHFPTNILPQIELNPWAEFAILQFQALSGGDYLANLVQWFSMAGCIIGVSLIASLFAATARGQLLSGLIAATIPMGILQSSSTQNDLVVSFWLVCFIVFGIMSARERSLAWIVLMSLSLGLAVLTKGTAYIFSAPFFWFFSGCEASMAARGEIPSSGSSVNWGIIAQLSPVPQPAPLRNHALFQQPSDSRDCGVEHIEKPRHSSPDSFGNRERFSVALSRVTPLCYRDCYR
jgi:hypothetical protein